MSKYEKALKWWSEINICRAFWTAHNVSVYAWLVYFLFVRIGILMEYFNLKIKSIPKVKIVGRNIFHHKYNMWSISVSCNFFLRLIDKKKKIGKLR